MMILSAVLIGLIILYLGIRDFPSKRTVEKQRKTEVFHISKWISASEKTFWFYAKQRQLLILYPKHMIREKYEKHVRTMLRNYFISMLSLLLLTVWSGFHPMMCLNLIVFPFLLAYKEDLKLKKDSDAHRDCILSQCPELFYQLSILMSSGLNIDAAISTIRRNTLEKGGMKYVLDKVYFELERGETLVHSVNAVAQNLNLRALNKFSVIVKQIVENGMKNAAGILIDLSEDTMMELQSEIRQKAEKISSKMMMPLMISLLCIMIMLAVPVILQM